MSRDGRAEACLEDIVQWAARLERHLAGRTLDDFLADPLLQDAVVRCITVIGEAAARVVKLDPSIAGDFPEWPADKAYAARNLLIHGYDIVEPAIVWRTAIESVPDFARQASAILSIRRKSSPHAHPDHQ